MSLREGFMSLALYGAEWVLWLLVGLSVVAVAIVLERLMMLRRLRVDVDGFASHVVRAVRRHEDRLDGPPGAMEVAVANAGLRYLGRGARRAAEAMHGVQSQLRMRYERRIAFLATVGNNAPFIGLFGTVLGVIAAFHELGRGAGAGSERVMATIAEALVATGVGLLVAIPAVVANNYLHRRVRQVIANAEVIEKLVLAEAGASEEA